MASTLTTYYIVTGPREETCEKTYMLIISTTATGGITMTVTQFGQGLFGLYTEVAAATLQVFGALPAIVQEWCTLYAYDPTNFDVYA